MGGHTILKQASAVFAAELDRLSAYTLVCRYGDRFICRSVFGVP